MFLGDKSNGRSFVHKVRQICLTSNVTEACASTWIKEVKDGFIQKNILCMSVNICEESGKCVVIDTRNCIQLAHGHSNQ